MTKATLAVAVAFIEYEAFAFIPSFQFFALISEWKSGSGRPYTGIKICPVAMIIMIIGNCCLKLAKYQEWKNMWSNSYFSSLPSDEGKMYSIKIFETQCEMASQSDERSQHRNKTFFNYDFSSNKRNNIFIFGNAKRTHNNIQAKRKKPTLRICFKWRKSLPKQIRQLTLMHLLLLPTIYFTSLAWFFLIFLKYLQYAARLHPGLFSDLSPFYALISFFYPFFKHKHLQRIICRIFEVSGGH